MIRVWLESKEQIPASLIERLKRSEQVEILKQDAVSDVRLIYVKVWNRSAFVGLNLNQQSKPPRCNLRTL